MSGQITGDLSQLAKRKNRGKETRRLSYRNDIRMHGESTYSGIHYTTVADDGQFEITDLIPGTVKLGLPGGQQDLRVTESMSGLTFHINKPEEFQSPPTREVIVRLTGLPEDLKVRGNLCLFWGGNGPLREAKVPPRNNQASTQVPTGSRLHIQTRGPVGFIAENIDSAAIPEGEHPLIIELPAMPAGAVHGTVLRADGQPAEGVSVHVFSDRTKIDLHKLQAQQATSNQSDSYFQSLPYGSSYCVLVREVTSKHFTWAVSDEFSVSADNPIHRIDLQLRPTRPFALTILDKNRQPVPNAAVELSISHSLRDQGASRRISRISDDNGRINFGLIGMDDQAASATSTGWLNISPADGFQGQQLKVDLTDDSMTVTLLPGVKASGILIDDVSGQTIPDAPVRVYPRHHSQANYFDNIRTRTDGQGQFEFTELEPIEYVGHVDEAVDPDAVVTLSPSGGNRLGYPNGHQPLLLHPGDDPVEWRVQILPGSDLKPLSAE